LLPSQAFHRLRQRRREMGLAFNRFCGPGVSGWCDATGPSFIDFYLDFDKLSKST
jgi:hypothetical protein